MRVYICDDEPQAAQHMLECVQAYFFENGEAYEAECFATGAALVAAAKAHKPDVVFLDIELKEENGLAVAKALRAFDKSCKLVFVTSHPDFKGQAFAVHAFGYIDKPATPGGVARQLDEARRYAAEERGTKTVTFETTEGRVPLALADIVCFENVRRRLRIQTISGEHWMRASVPAVAKQLEGQGFASPHVSFVVNLAYVADIRGYTIKLVGGGEIPLSQRRSTAFRAALDAYLLKELAGEV